MPSDKKSKVTEPEEKVVEKDPSDIVNPKPKLKDPYVVPMEEVAAKIEIPEGNSEYDKIHAQMTEILKKYNMCESDVPLPYGNHPDAVYWELRNKLQSMRS